MQQSSKRLLELKAPNWQEWAFTDGNCITNKKMDLSQLELDLTTLNATKSPQLILEGQAPTKP
jgi:hypothetical protein